MYVYVIFKILKFEFKLNACSLVFYGFNLKLSRHFMCLKQLTYKKVPYVLCRNARLLFPKEIS